MDSSTVIVIFSGATLVVAICCLLILVSRRNSNDTPKTQVSQEPRFVEIKPIQESSAEKPTTETPKNQGDETAIVYKRVLPNGEYTINYVTGAQALYNTAPNRINAKAFIAYLENKGYTTGQVKIEIVKQGFKSKQDCIKYKEKLVKKSANDPKFLQYIPTDLRNRDNRGKHTASPYPSSEPKDRGADTMFVYKNILPDGKYTINMATGAQAINSFYNGRSPVMVTYMEKNGYEPSQIKHVVIKQDFDSKEECAKYKEKLVNITRQDLNFLCAKEVQNKAPKHTKKTKTPKAKKDCKTKIYLAKLPDGKYFVGTTSKRLKDVKISTRANVAANYMKEHGYKTSDLKKEFLYTEKDYKNKDEYLALREQVLRRCADDPKCLNQIHVCPECGTVGTYHKKGCSKRK